MGFGKPPEIGNRKTGRIHRFMQHRVRDILWVCSLYDSFRVERDGQLRDLLFRDYRQFGITNVPGVRRVTSGQEALHALEEEDFDLVISLDRVGDTSARNLGLEMKRAIRGLPFVVLTTSARASPIRHDDDVPSVDRYFAWSGDSRLFFTVVKYVEDLLNVERDVLQGGTLALLFVESSSHHYSSLLPSLYFELMERNRAIARKGRNLTERAMKRRARPKLLVAQSYEEALRLLEEYGEHLLGMVSGIPLSRDNTTQDEAGLELVRHVLEIDRDLPVMMMCRDQTEWDKSESLGVRRLLWNDEHADETIRSFFIEDVAFGEFVFRRPDGTEVARAENIRNLMRKITYVDDECVQFHAAHNHFSRWLRAHAEFQVAALLRSKDFQDFDSIAQLRAYLIEVLKDYVEEQRRGTVSDFDPVDFDPSTPIVQLSGGSLGAKAQGLASMSSLLAHYRATSRFEGTCIDVPATAVIGTDSFDAFMENNDLWDFIEREPTDQQIVRRFKWALLPSELLSHLEVFLESVDCPIAVRSSSLFEDSVELPLAGVYETYMLPNEHPDLRVRLSQLVEAIRRVYASTFFYNARNYLLNTPFRIRDEKMAVILQRVVGHRYGKYFYPAFSGVARSYNYYPFGTMRAEDGICLVGLGMGKWIVDGGKCVQFCPAKPTVSPHMSTTQDILKNTQREFFALKLDNPEDPPHWEENENLVRLDLNEARQSGGLRHTGSVYSHDNDMIYGGVMREGNPLVTFSQLLRSESFPLAKQIKYLLDLGTRAMSTAVEIEFAVDLDPEDGKPREFGFLQIRPMNMAGMSESVALDDVDMTKAVCVSSRALGNGIIENLTDIIYVPRENLDRSKTRDVAREIEKCNARLLEQRTPYVLIGPGRWGSSDRWLGIPIRWSMISGARLIIEVQFEDIATEPSQGAHFFHNLTAFQVGYFTVDPVKDPQVNYEWLDRQRVLWQGQYVRHLKTKSALEIRIDGRKGRGVLLAESR